MDIILHVCHDRKRNTEKRWYGQHYTVLCLSRISNTSLYTAHHLTDVSILLQRRRLSVIATRILTILFQEGRPHWLRFKSWLVGTQFTNYNSLSFKKICLTGERKAAPVHAKTKYWRSRNIPPFILNLVARWE
jgi:hypothetical protein